MTKDIYMDNSATTRTFDEVACFMADIATKYYGNPSSLHTKGLEAERLMKEARNTIASTIGASLGEIYFTSGGTESNNFAIRGYLSANPRKGKRIITSKIEHPSVLEVYKHLEANGYDVQYIDVDTKGIIRIDKLAEALNNETALVSLILVNNETGTIQPLAEISSLIRKMSPQAALHVDAVQAYGKIKLEPARTGIGLMSISSHKIHGPKGVGALYVKKGIKIHPVMFGGGQESALRSGTENVPGICGFAKAAGIVFPDIEASSRKVSEIKKLFIDKLAECGREYRVLSPEDSIPYILNVSFPDVKAEVLLHHLEQEGIYASTGSACSSRKRIHSHVLKSLGVEPCFIEGALRYSFSAYENSENDIPAVIEALKRIVPIISTSRRRRQ